MTLRDKAIAHNRETHDALALIVAALNKGQRQKLLKDPAVKALLDRYRVEVPA